MLPPQFESGRWYCIEIMLDGVAPLPTRRSRTARVNYWIDGVQYGPRTKLWLRTTSALKVNILWLSLYHHEAHSTAGIMLDDVVVSSTRIGCHGTPGQHPRRRPIFGSSGDTS